MVLGKKVAIFDLEWGRNSAPRDRQKIPCHGVVDTVKHLYLGEGYIYLVLLAV